MKLGKIRIIGGKWKGKKLSFHLDSKLRPTPDRAKEMIFNWLGQDLVDLNCLDLFSGTGAMGLESLSRGCKKVFFVEKDTKTFKKLKENLSLYSTVALGSIAMHAVRGSKTSIGEISLVVGLGFIGQITMQILIAAVTISSTNVKHLV